MSEHRQVHATARTPGASPEDYAWQDEGPLGPIYTITLVRGVEEHEVLRRLGAAPEHIRLIDVDEYPDSSRTEIAMVRVGDWSILIEECGRCGVQREVIGELSRDGGEAVAVMRHDYAPGQDFAYALDGELLTGFDPSRPGTRWGTAPDRLNSGVALVVSGVADRDAEELRQRLQRLELGIVLPAHPQPATAATSAAMSAMSDPPGPARPRQRAFARPYATPALLVSGAESARTAPELPGRRPPPRYTPASLGVPVHGRLADPRSQVSRLMPRCGPSLTGTARRRRP
ncbi:hypothetical protein Msi02_53020 [Microbispora siamensis]|uniref:Uncharacterized protein n=1 Tax=Microbispora siamensis TaxID=564413 RepID=A0ABQ4GSU4_9ACTN|nr:hypothetical protein Msi02_53020 [Microbispora siamensis]